VPSDQTSWSRGEKLAAAAIFALALALRLLHLREISLHDPFFALPSTQERLVQQWAIEIASGNWWGEGAFVRAPLYPYFLGLLYSVFGSGIAVAMIANSLIGALSCVLIVAVGRRSFDRRAALIAGALFAADSMAIFYAGMLATVNLLVPLVLLLVLAAQRAHEAPSAVRWFGAGVVLGLCALGWQALLLFTPFLLAWPALSRSSRVSQRAAWMVLLFAGVVTVILPVSLRNFSPANDFVLVHADLGVSFYTGNHPNARGTYGMPRRYPRVIADEPVEQWRLFEAVAEQASGRDLGPAAISAFWLREGLEYISSHPVQWLQHEIRRFGLSWNAAERWQERSPAVARTFSWVRRMPLVGFGVAGPFALLGLGIAAREWRRLYLLYGVVAVWLTASVIFSVDSRERLPAIPVLLLFASVAACWFWDRIRSRRVRALTTGLLGLGLAVGLVHLPLSRENFAMAYYQLGDRFAQLEQWDAAIEYFGRSLNRDPGAISTWSHLALAYEEHGESPQEAVHTWLRVLDLARRQDDHLHAERAEQHLRDLGMEPLVAPPGPH
jgi:tetratricopeptide (TPR) repeat protein